MLNLIDYIRVIGTYDSRINNWRQGFKLTGSGDYRQQIYYDCNDRTSVPIIKFSPFQPNRISCITLYSYRLQHGIEVKFHYERDSCYEYTEYRFKKRHGYEIRFNLDQTLILLCQWYNNQRHGKYIELVKPNKIEIGRYIEGQPLPVATGYYTH